MAALYLEHYLDSLEELPVELQRNFTLMRELDIRSQELLRAIDKAADEMLHHFVTSEKREEMSSEDRREAVASIQAQYVKVKEYADDKVQLAIQTYELVDKHIRRLDSDLARFEVEIQERADKHEEQTGLNAAAARKKTSTSVALSRSVAGRKKMLEKEALKKKKKKRLPAPSPPHETTSTTSSTHKKKKKTSEESGSEKTKGVDDDELIDMPVDPNEPTYCFCQQVSYGQMIGCDFPDCPIEWFHFACVNLTVKPKGKWFCPKCSTDKKTKK